MYQYDPNLIQSLIIQPPKLETSLNDKVGSNNLILTIQSSISNPRMLGQIMVKTLIQSYKSDTQVSTVIKDFQKAVPELKDKSGLLLKYNNILYEDGTLESCNIQSHSTVGIVALDNDKEAIENEGFRLIFWAVIPLLISISFLTAGLVGKFDMQIRAIYVFIATVIGVPATVATVLGIVEKNSALMKAGIVGEYWFSPNCCSCRPMLPHTGNFLCCWNCCRKKDEMSSLNMPNLIEKMKNAIKNVDDQSVLSQLTPSA